MLRNPLLVTIVVATALFAMAAAAAAATQTTTTNVYADLLARDDIPDLPIGGNATTLGEIDVAIAPYDGYLPENGTLTISTLGANDLDINAMPPDGMTIIIDNKSATITSHPVRVEMTTQPPASAAPSDEGGDEDE